MYSKSPEISAYAQSAIQTFPDHYEHLQECRIAYLVTDEDIRMQGRDKAGFVIMPTAMGQNGKIFDYVLAEYFGFIDECYEVPVAPDVVMVISQDVWEGYNSIQRVCLICHELMHIAHAETKDGEQRYNEEDGRPVFTLLGHDVEEFTAIAAMFGQTTRWAPFSKVVLESKVDARVQEVLDRVATGSFEPLPKRPPPPAFKCSKCANSIKGKVVQGWLVITEACPACGASLKPVSRQVA